MASTAEYMENDKNTIMAALMRKGATNDPSIKIIEPSNNKINSEKAGPAEKKLKSLFKREVKE